MNQIMLNQDLSKAITAKDVTAVRRALEKGADPNTVMKNGSPLLLAVSKFSDYPCDLQIKLDIASALIEAGANVNQKDKNGQPLLIGCIATSESASFFKLLLDAGADVNIQVEMSGNEKKSNLIDYALRCNRPKEVVDLLRGYGSAGILDLLDTKDDKTGKFATIKSDNLRLAVLEELIHLKVLPASDTETLYQQIFHKEYDDEAGYEPIEKIKNHLLGQDLPDKYLKVISGIGWSGGISIQHVIYPYWDGEDEYYHIEDFSGIEVLENLESIAGNLFLATDVRPLAGLKKLSSVQIENQKAIENLCPFLELPELKKLSLPAVSTAENRAVETQLSKKGVATKIAWENS